VRDVTSLPTLPTLTAVTLTASPEWTPYPAPPGTVPAPPEPPGPHLRERAAEHAPHPDSPVGRAAHREDTRPEGHLPVRTAEGEVGYTAPPLRYLTDVELAEWTHALLAEHQRRTARHLRAVRR